MCAFLFFTLVKSGRSLVDILSLKLWTKLTYPMIYLALEQAHEAYPTNVKALSLVSIIFLAPVVHSAPMWVTDNLCNHSALAATPFCCTSISGSYQKAHLTFSNNKKLTCKLNSTHF